MLRTRDLRPLKKDSQQYWEEVLRRENLSMERGRHRKLSYVGMSRDLVSIERDAQENEWLTTLRSNS